MTASFEGKTFCEIGAARGDNIALFLRLGMKGHAVEAHPELAAALHRRFADPIGQGRLEVLNLAAAEEAGETRRFACLPDTVRSHLIDPSAEPPTPGTVAEVETTHYPDLIARSQVPDYLSIRIGGLEHAFIQSMAGRVLPGHVCANFSSPKSAVALYDVGYRKFRFVNVLLNRAHRAVAPDGTVVAPGTGSWDGWFGDLLPGRKWLSIEEIAVVVHGLPKVRVSDTAIFGWFDIHAAL